MEAKKPTELVEKLLNEDPGDEKLDPIYVQRRDAARAHGGHPTPGAAARAEDDDEDIDDMDDPDNEIDFHSAEEFEAKLAELIEENIPGARTSTYQEAGVLTRNNGLVVRTPGGNFQITIVEDRR